MNDFNVFSLGNYRFRRMNLIVAPIILGIDLMIRLLHISYFWQHFFNVHIVLHLFLLIALISAVLSKEKTDDEVAQRIRYAAFKLTLSVFVMLAGLSVYVLNFLHIANVQLLPILYFLESSMVFYLILTYYSFRKTPSWIFKEPTSPQHYSTVMITIYIMILVLIAFVAVFNLYLSPHTL
jgi:hypothetical protein